MLVAQDGIVDEFDRFEPPHNYTGVGGGGPVWQPKRLHHIPSAEEFRDFVKRGEPFVLALNDPEYKRNKDASKNSEGECLSQPQCSQRLLLAGHERWQQHLMGAYEALAPDDKNICGLANVDNVFGLRTPFPHDPQSVGSEPSCPYVAFLFKSPTHQTWNVGSAESAQSGEGGWIAGVEAPATLPETSVPCPTNVREWLVSNGTSWLLDVGLSITDAVHSDENAALAAHSEKMYEECKRYPSGHAGGGLEEFDCHNRSLTETELAALEKCPPLFVELGWDRICTKWTAEYMCEAAGHKEISLARASRDTELARYTFGGVNV